jgi:hypothetical protein
VKIPLRAKAFVIHLLITAGAISQTNYGKQIDQLMIQVRAGTTLSVDRAGILAQANYKSVYPALSKYFADTTFNVRMEALAMSAQLARKTMDTSVIRQSIKDNLDNCTYKGSINTQLVGLLKKYTRSDFGQRELGLMKNKLEENGTNLGLLAKIYAFAGKESAAPALNSLLTKATLSKIDKKDIKLALIRSGDNSLADKMHEKMKEMVVDDQLIYSGLDDIIYTKNKLLYGFLLNAILKNEKKCTSANNDDNTYISCAYRLIERLAPVITNFPAKVNNTGDLVTKNPEETLSTVRAWIQKNQDSFEINSTVY